MKKNHFRRHLRTLFLAIFATVVFIFGSIRIFEIDPQDMLGYLFSSLLGLAILLILALSLVLIWVLLKKLCSRKSDEG